MEEYFKRMIKDFGFEKRPGQEEMSKIVRDSIFGYNSILIEAGTGIGKTLAYLIPAVIFAKKAKTRVVITTNTINLQEQLVEKDLPFLEKIMGEDIEYEIVKGRSNYVCGNRLMKNSSNEKLIEWYKNTKTGDKAEIDFAITNEEWTDVCSDVDFCCNAGCAKTDKCFFYKSRKKLQNKEILIVNHSLLFSSFKYEGIIPEFDVLIIDEAHNIENVARTYFEKKVSSKDLVMTIGQIHNNKSNTGALRRYINVLINELGEETRPLLDDMFLNISEALNKVYESILKVFNELILKISNTGNRDVRESKIKHELDMYYEYLTDLSIKKHDLVKESKKILDLSSEIDPNDEDRMIFLSLYNKLIENIDLIYEIEKSSQEDYVNWFRYDIRKTEVVITSTPLDISKYFKEQLEKYTVVMTSATLRVSNSFKYIKERLGVDYPTYVVESPFDYDKNMLIGISNNEYDPNSEEYLKYCIKFLNGYIASKNQGTFILCTSYNQLNRIYDGLNLKGFNVLKQGDMSRSMLISKFKKEEKAILIGTDSFWEGVDVKGESLKNVVIVKIPFQTPDNPVTEALIEYINKQGKNSFMDYQLPTAVIKLRQGVGRLIRSKEDSGEVIILDSRIHTKRYGKIILNSLPSKNILKF